MSEHQIKVLVVDDDERARRRLIEHLRFDDMQVVGESNLGAAAFTWASQLDVDVIVVSVQEPIARALRTIESLTVGERTWPVIGVSPLTDRETTRKAIVAGVRDFLVLPLPTGELRRSILGVLKTEEGRQTGAAGSRLGTIITVFGVKGGIGKSSVSSNVATALAQETRQHVALADLDLHFGDAAIMLDLAPRASITDAVREIDPGKPHGVEEFLTPHVSTLRLLAAPFSPDEWTSISPERVGRVLEALAAINDYVVVDTGAQIDPVSAVAMDMSTIVLVLTTPEVPCLRRTRTALAMMEESGYSRDKVKLVVNRVDPQAEVSVEEIEKVLGYPVYAQIPDDREVAKAISLGVPVVMSNPKAKAAIAISALSRGLVGGEAPGSTEEKKGWKFWAKGSAKPPAAQQRTVMTDDELREIWKPVIPGAGDGADRTEIDDAPSDEQPGPGLRVIRPSA